MKKLQPLYPIPELDTSTDFELIARFDERNLTYLKDDYLKLPGNTIIPPLLRIESRIDIIDNQVKRRPYRAGVIAGSIISRARLHDANADPAEVFSQDVIDDIDWSAMRIARFALRQFFAEGIDVKRHLYETVELPWAMENSTFVDPDARQHELREDWMVIGLGDTFRLVEMAYSRCYGLPLRDPIVVGLANDDAIM